MKMLEGKNTLVTGGARGSGRGIALAYAREGANVAFTYLSHNDEVDQLKEELEGIGVKCLAIEANATDPEAIQNLIQILLDEWKTIDVVVNNAGITQDNLLLRMSLEQFNAVIQTNLYSIFHMTKAIMRPLLKQRSGSIINISSIT